jgi:hypothetical protein
METKILSVNIAHRLGIVQLMTSEVDSFDYITGGKAIELGWLEVKEINAGGSVNTIYIHNTSDRYVFLMDGDILSGAKQNRVVNTSMLLAPHLGTKVPVSCVERGRWRATSGTFSQVDYTAPHEMRRSKMQNVNMNLKGQGTRDANQGEVWGMVDDYQNRHQVTSSTANLSDTYEQKRKATDDLTKTFPLHAGANGAAVFFGHRLVGVDIFHRRDVFAEYFPKILRAVMLEVQVAEKTEKALAEAEASFRTSEFLDMVLAAPRDAYPGVGVGTEMRIDAETASGLILEFQKHTIHLAAMVKQGEERRHSARKIY